MYMANYPPSHVGPRESVCVCPPLRYTNLFNHFKSIVPTRVLVPWPALLRLEHSLVAAREMMVAAKVLDNLLDSAVFQII